MTDLTLYTNPMSRGRTARWMVEEIAAAGGPVARVEIVEFGPPMKAPDYLALNPMGKVPTLLHGEVVVTEVAAICAYLADTFPQAGLAPAPGAPERGAYYRWLFFAAGPLEAALLDKSFGIEPQDMETQGRTGYGSVARVTDTLETVLGAADYVAGPRFGAADLYLASALGWAMFSGGIDRRPAFEAFVGRCMARPAAQAAQEKDGAIPDPAAGG